MARYLRPSRLEDAVAALAERAWVIVAGATDHYPARVGRPPDDDVLDVTALDELGGISEDASGWRIGALVTWSEAAGARLPPLFDGLRAAAGTIGGVQIQNRGTIAGNLCNASPAADGVPVLLTLDAEVELASLAGRRRVPLASFITGYRRTARAPDELVTAIHVPSHRGAARAAFLKLGSRHSLVISIAMVAGAVSLREDGRVASAALAVGACSPVAVRLPALEARLAGAALDASLAGAVEARDLEHLAPIDDMRGSAAYRREAALVLLRRLLAQLAGGAAAGGAGAGGAAAGPNDR
jgi:CO/xanthine dehydrogenase FAD-binding subunit